MVWNKQAECMSKEEKEKLQLERLQQTVKLAYNNVSFYKEKFDEAGITPEDIKTLKDIEKIPFTTKDDLRAAYPFGLFAVPYEEIVEIHASSGTSGKPTVTGYTKEDLDIWSECIARGLGMVGVEKEYILQNAFGYGLFTGGFGIHHGAQKFGAITVPISAGNTKRQLETMKDFQSDVITCTPSYAMYLGESLENSDINLEDINLKIGIHGAEMWTEEMRHKIEDTLNIKAYNIYGLTEIMGPGVAQECVEQNGMHIQDDHFYPEIINPKTGETLPAGQKGELVLTTLTKTGIPILRFRTKDLTSLIIEQCACGRTSVRMSRITGRSDDMLKIRGVMVFPSQIEKALLKIKGASPNYLIKVTRPDTLDEVEVKVEATKELFSDEMKEMEIAGMGQYAHGNQPIQHMPYLYSYAGQPWKTQYWVRQIVERLYNSTERGYPGDEDQGGMSSWYILSSLGIYAVCPGTDEYVIGSPLFKKATITMENGNKFVIEANNNSKENLYIQSATLNGRVLDKNFIRYDDIADGGIIRFEMGSQPNKERCTSKYAAPFSLSKE